MFLFCFDSRTESGSYYHTWSFHSLEHGQTWNARFCLVAFQLQNREKLNAYYMSPSHQTRFTAIKRDLRRMPFVNQPTIFNFPPFTYSAQDRASAVYGDVSHCCNESPSLYLDLIRCRCLNQGEVVLCLGTINSEYLQWFLIICRWP